MRLPTVLISVNAYCALCMICRVCYAELPLNYDGQVTVTRECIKNISNKQSLDFRLGTYSNLGVNENSGDVIGEEILIIRGNTGEYKGILQTSPGFPLEPGIVDVYFEGNSITFQAPATIADADSQFLGIIDEHGIKGAFIYSNGTKQDSIMPRSRSYWDKLTEKRTGKNDADDSPTGTFSNVTFNENTGKYKGEEIRIVYGAGGYKGILQLYSAFPRRPESVYPYDPVIVPVLIDKDKIIFHVPAFEKDIERWFVGEINRKSIKGHFNINGGGIESNMPRNILWWERPKQNGTQKKIDFVVFHRY